MRAASEGSGNVIWGFVPLGGIDSAPPPMQGDGLAQAVGNGTWGLSLLGGARSYSDPGWGPDGSEIMTKNQFHPLHVGLSPISHH